MGFQNPIVGGTALRIPAIQSPNYSPGVAGWIVKINGDAEFNNLTIRGTFLGADFILNSSGLFIYNGTPAAGNLIASIAAAGGTDSFGNTYLSDIVSYQGLGFVALSSGNLLSGLTADGYSKAGLVGSGGVNTLYATSPVDSTSFPNPADHSLIGGTRTVTPQSAAGFPHHEFDGTLWLNDPAIKAVNNANTWTPETWHTPTFAANWATTGTLNGNSTFQGMQYRKDAEDNVWISGGAVSSGAGGTVFTLPSGYLNSSRRHLLPCWIFDSSAGTTIGSFAQVTETGVVNIAASLTGVTIATGDQVYINGKFPLGNIG